MAIEFECQNCGFLLKAPDEYHGGRARCKNCGMELRIPKRNQDGVRDGCNTVDAATVSDQSQSDLLDGDLIVACPNCKLRFGVELMGQEADGKLRVTCDHCGVEKTLKAFQREYQKQVWKEELERQAEAAEKLHAEASAGTSPFPAGVKVDPDEVIRTIAQAASDSQRILFEGAYTPSVALLKDEKILDVFEASFWDLGLIGWVCRHKRKMLLTNKRVFYFRKKTIDCVLDVVWLKRIKAVTIGQEIKVLQFIIGVSLLLFSLVNKVVSLGGSAMSGLSRSYGSWYFINFLFLVQVGAAIALIVLARRKILALSTGEDKLRMKLARIQSEESSRFVDRIFSVLDEGGSCASYQSEMKSDNSSV